MLTLASGVEFVVKNFRAFGDLLGDSIGIGLSKAKALFIEFSAFVVDKMSKLVYAVADMFPTMFDGIAKTAMTGLTSLMEGLGNEAGKTQADIDRLGASIDYSIGDIDTKLTAFEAFETVKTGVEAFAKSMNSAADSSNRISYSVGLTTRQLQEAEKAAALLAKQQKDLQGILKTNQQIAMDISMQDATARDRLKMMVEYQLSLVDAKERELELAGELSESQRIALENQRELIKAKGTQEAQKLPSATFENLAAMGTKIGENITSVFTQGAMSAVGGFATVVGAVVSAASAVLDLIPNMINSIAGLFDKITDFPNMLVGALQKLWGSITRFISDAIPNFVKAIPQIIKDALNFLLVALPEAFVDLLTSLPDIIINAVEELPSMIIKFVDKLVENLPVIVESLIKFIVEELPAITAALGKFLFIKLPEVMFKAFLKIVNSLAKMVGDLLSGKGLKLPKVEIDTKQMSKSVKSVEKTLTDARSKLFAVTELANIEKTKEAANNISQQISEGAKKAGNYLKERWDAMMSGLKVIWDGLMNIFRGVWDFIKGIWSGLMGMLQGVWDAIKNIWDGMLSGLGKAWEWVSKNIINPLVNGIKAAWSWVEKYIVKPLTNGLKNLMEGAANIGNAIWKPIKDGFGTLGAIISDAVKNAFKEIGNVGKDLGKNVSSGIKKIFGFYEGGIVPGRSSVSGNSPLNDSILAMLSPGEAVIPRDRMSDPFIANIINAILGDNKLGPKGSIPMFNNGGMVPGEYASVSSPIQRINAGLPSTSATVQQGQSTTNIELNIDIKTTQPIDEAFFRNKLMPKVKDELKRFSLDGGFVLSSSGVRS